MTARWPLRRLRDVAELRVSNVDKHVKEGEVPVRLCNYVDVYKNDRITERLAFMEGTATEDEAERFRLLRGDVLITKDSETWTDIGVPALVEYEAQDLVSGYHLALLRPRRGRVIGSFLFRALQSPDVAHQLHVAATGVTRYGLSHAAIKSVVLPVAPLPHQNAIVRFLDHADRRIRRAIHAKQKLVALLNEQKQAVIHRAVTRGLDPNVRLKPSGVDWLGEMPEHWETRRIHALFRERVQTGRSDLPILAVSIANGVTLAGETTSEGRPRKLIEDLRQYKIAREGDIAYNTMRMWQGAVGVVPTTGLISPAYVVCAPRIDTNSAYYALLFRTSSCRSAIVARSRGIADDRNRLYWEAFKALAVPVPPAHEQARIVDALDHAASRDGIVVDAARREVDLLREYRVRLIADVVTGKLDVREAAARLLEEVGEPEPLDEIEAQLSEESEVEDLEAVEP